MSKLIFGNMRSIFLSLFLFLVLPVAVQAEANCMPDDWQINAFHADISIQADRNVQVEETIVVEYLSSDVCRGLIRTVPVKYEDQFGSTFDSSFRFNGVMKNGLEEPSKVTKQNNGNDIRMRFGDANMYLDQGVYSYEISYEVRDVFLFGEEFDEFYWNVTGSDWEVPMQNVTASIDFPNDAKIIQRECYTGGYGSENQECSTSLSGSGLTVFAQDFLTVAVGIEKGSIHSPTFLYTLFSFLSSDWPIWPPFIFVILSFVLWNRNGKDKSLKPIIAEYEPPENKWVAETAVLAGSSNLKKVITGIIVQLAVKGYIKIHIEQKKNGKVKEMTFTKLKDAGALNKPYSTVFSYLFTKGDMVTLSDLKKRSATTRMTKVVTFTKESLINEGLFKKGEKSTIPYIVTGIAFIFIWIGGFVMPLSIPFSIIAFIICSILSVHMEQYTEIGYELARKAHGFKLFMHTAERYRSKWQEKKGIFEEYLPYAIAFGHTKVWAKAFPDLVLEDQEWISGVRGMSYAHFASVMNHNIGAVSSSASVPVSSGSSGGGSSGGGFGGGGGGSW